MPAKRTRDPGLNREAPPALIVIAIISVVLAVGAGGFYFYNGNSWQTQGQREDYARHNLRPIMAAKHGDKTLLDAENTLRKEHGQPPLEMPKDKAQSAESSRDKLMALQKQLEGHQGKESGQ